MLWASTLIVRRRVSLHSSLSSFLHPASFSTAPEEKDFTANVESLMYKDWGFYRHQSSLITLKLCPPHAHTDTKLPFILLENQLPVNYL